ncbi:MAG: polyribonucleotide nucleotidyltransferase [Patescibacteria group bacterium]|nr:polyribonucleotide nucleotidyltransferase [Patescibacteria group bacterium]
MNKEKVFSCDWLGRTLTIKTGKLALQANSAVTVQYGDTVILATVVESAYERDGIDYFPLMVDFEEKLYAAGMIKGSKWVKREGRPTDESVLTGRMIDRTIRPLFDESSRKDIQVVLSVMSVDQKNDFDIVSLVAASAALSISGVKWDGPIAGIRLGKINGGFVFNPTYEERAESSFDLIVAGTKERVLMIEAGAQETKEDIMYEAIVAGQKGMRPAIDLIEKLKAEVEVKKVTVREKLVSPEEKVAEAEKEKVLEIAQAWLAENTKKTVFDVEYYKMTERKAAVAAIKHGLDKHLFDKEISKTLRSMAIGKLVEKFVDDAVTEGILKDNKRVDGRAFDQIRDLYSEVGLLPRTHGTSLFNRGETQVMSITTLGGPGLEQTIDSIEGETQKRFMHHYNFPAFSVGEARPNRGPGRRDIGHGALAEKALEPVIPSKDDFPYTIRVVSETLGSNGSSSMASTCASSMTLMDAGVPIKRAVAGIAIGMASSRDMSEWKILTDIQDIEDGQGGMDFKVTGTTEGITAIQLDTKSIGLSQDIVKEALERGYKARLQILDVMNAAIEAPRAELSEHAPRVTSFKIDTEKIRDVIGPGGKIINAIIDECNVTIDIDDDGTVYISGVEAKGTEKAIDWVKSIVKDIEAGEIYHGKVVRILDFGAFIELLPGKDGMAHVSELAPYRIGAPSDFVSEGDMVWVKVKEIDDKGRVNLTLKGLPENEILWKDEKGKQEGNGAGGGDRSGRPSNGRPQRSGGFNKR